MVIAPNDTITPEFLQNGRPRPRHARPNSGTAEPKGTGHAVQCALESDPVPSGAMWVRPTATTSLEPGPACRVSGRKVRAGCVGLRPGCLGPGSRQNHGFAVLEGDGTVHCITEKPDASVVERLAASGSVRVSMNGFRPMASASRRIWPHWRRIQNGENSSCRRRCKR